MSTEQHLYYVLEGMVVGLDWLNAMDDDPNISGPALQNMSSIITSRMSQIDNGEGLNNNSINNIYQSYTSPAPRETEVAILEAEQNRTSIY